MTRAANVEQFRYVATEPDELWWPIRMVAIDLDGTLLDDSKKISDQTVQALACLPMQDIRVVIASARPPRSVRHVYHSLRLDTLQINYNGALIWDEPKRSVVFHRPMTGELVRRMIDESRARFDEVLVTCEVLDRWYTDRFEQPYTTETGRLFRPDVIAELDDFCDQDITKLLLLGPPEMMDDLQPIVSGQYGEDVTVVRADPELIQIMDKRVSKATAVDMVAKQYGIPMKQVMAIGDAPNDVGMLQMAGIAVAMDNAHARVKQVADWVAPSNNDHGVHAALKRYGLCE
jgi:Cof subfamily protein (haloacid dehalogenase superfamily)